MGEIAPNPAVNRTRVVYGFYFANAHTARRLPYTLNLSCALHHHSHSVGLDHRDGCLWGDEFAFGDNIDNVVGETRFAAWSQNGNCGALHPRRQRKRSGELPRRTGERWARRI